MLDAKESNKRTFQSIEDFHQYFFPNRALHGSSSGKLDSKDMGQVLAQKTMELIRASLKQP
jgi:hypothetical protein